MKTSEQSRRRIIEAAVRIVRRHGPMGTTTEAVAREAACAKGLVHYHFRGKEALWNEVIVHLADGRNARWRRAFAAASPDEAIQRTWKAVLQDHESGAIRLMGTIAGTSDQSDRAIRSVMTEFVRLVGSEVAVLLSRVGLTPSVPELQLGWMLANAANGAAMHLGAGIAARELEDGYAATWVGILALTRGG